MKKIELREAETCENFSSYMQDTGLRTGMRELAADPFFVAFFLMTVSEGEGMGEAGVAAIRQDEVAGLLHDIERQQHEEARHKTGTRDLARKLFPEYFTNGEYRFSKRLTGAEYYLSVLEQNRRHLKERGRYSRLNLYLTTTFGYEIMVVLLYEAVIKAIATSSLSESIREACGTELRRILAEEETHLEIEDQHNALLAADRNKLSVQAAQMLSALEDLEVDDYQWAVRASMDEIVRMMSRYAEPTAFRAHIESSPAA
jgi:hypothetical protein